MASISPGEANGIIEEIRVANGGIDDVTRKTGDVKLLKAIMSLREKLAAATSTLADQLYTKKIRFVFELIQNAEDNQYNAARKKGLRPFLTFLILDTTIQIDSNEDGFLPEDVEAICSVGQSTKTTTTQDYIGEKGIGFKSVFGLASRVRVQSGPFCFYFRNGEEDGGLGMVTPYIEKPDDLPSGVRTRFTLTLKDPSESSQYVEDFEELPNTLPLFLTKLKDIKIIFGGNNKRRERAYRYDLENDGHIGKLTVSNESESGAPTSTTQRYHVIKRTAQNLPPAEARGANNTAEVILKFPIDADGYPKIESQHVFAFLPLRKEGFDFIIQSDFITQASREDILDNPWNEALRDYVAHTFVDAVLRFCQDEQLCTTWMRYLPKDVKSGFWVPLKSKIASLLQCQRILKPWSGGTLRLPIDLRWLTKDKMDEHDEPLFRDKTNLDELYLSRLYYWRDFEILRDVLSMKNVNADDIIERVEADLDRPDSFI